MTGKELTGPDCSMRIRHKLPALLAGIAFALGTGGAVAQDYSLCVKLEARLVQLDRNRSGGSPVTIKRNEKAFAEQERRLSVSRQRALRDGCGQQKGFLFFRPPRPPQCREHDEVISELESGLKKLRWRRVNPAPVNSNSSKRERRNILEMLGENKCGPQYARFARKRNGGLFGFFLRDYSRDPYMEDRGNAGFYGTYRTLCVRSCDGFFWPISFSTVQSHFGYDEQLCQRSCPTTDVSLYVHRNPGEGPAEAMSLAGQPYSASANAFRYRDEYVNGCSCRASVQTAALGTLQLGAVPSGIVTPGEGEDIAERVMIALAARDGKLPGGEPEALSRPQIVEPPIAVFQAPIPRVRPGNELPVAGSIATLTGLEDFQAVSAPNVREVGGKSVRIVGPGFTLYRSSGEQPQDDQ